MFIQGLLNPVSKKLILNVYWKVVMCQHVKERREKKKLPQPLRCDYGSKGMVSITANNK